ncbi:hypothetical protein ['Camptotheca acuminata' phytoplasma]|uniref:hypothetical protein n=1 Tax='Camptotheca acuminata' phytoplasma TaxID=3239192 RepID=UPI00351A676F
MGKLDTLLFVGESTSQNNKIQKNTENEKMLIFITLSNEEKEQKIYKETKNNQIFHKKYNELNLEDIKNTKNRKIYIFAIKKYDWTDKTNNPLTETKLE